MKKYSMPDIEIVDVDTSDVITTSPGIETPLYEETDGIWDFSINP